MIRKLLIANRGEIACRIIRTARAMNIATVAVHSDADATALHVRSADEAVHIGPPPAAESYLRGDRIIAAAQAAGADAVHPGYGFLSENADFAQAVLDAGLIWVGPRPASIRAMGLKDAAKQLMRSAGVPVTPGYDGSDQSVERLAREADTIGYPVLIKAVAGGGGKGMRKVDAPADFAAALESCRREAQASFGNDEVLLEKWITSPRHIEVQVFGDAHGNVVHLFERDCSLQRRHQKVIEEAPAPGMDAATREAICAAAVRAAKAVDYEGAGTIEFIADASEGLRADRIFFMEMNTRLQVEHPVTEEITGVDLVEWQLRVAGGEPLPRQQAELSITGHAIEARLYAEDPARGFLPSIGVLRTFDMPQDGGDTRIDTGVRQGDEITPFYDPMIAKVIVHQHTRDDAIEALRGAVAGIRIRPVRTNAAFLHRVLTLDAFVAGTMTTSLLGDHPELGDKPPLSQESLVHAAKRLRQELQRTSQARGSGDERMLGVRLNAPPKRTATIYVDGVAREVPWGDDEASTATPHPSAFEPAEDGFTWYENGEAYAVSLAKRGTGHHSAADGAVAAPMPGKVIAVDVAEGQAVTAGQRLLVLEAMKMEHALTAPFDGTVTQLSAAEGQQVQVDDVLAIVAPDAD
ncbi:biotin/lipoyl-binding protein [Erythrobacteraceae bacterium CFH 75059]|uniref:acetyl/propionyl/methylcrotonyl-CoA carboxylase subunit alpha n=1 Tax=Qipengyuania thermophila TaxID=2509361 RepID=UPI0010215062|nr:biotin carboxylase N-terminal domain-containing protein [Qipengyuania thermophila]TCD04843.1 biotin/lipoyl-binding protein [Erythrobacteraceae bacterium CFH 75059]